MFSAQLSPVVSSEDSRLFGALRSRQVSVLGEVAPSLAGAIALTGISLVVLIWNERRSWTTSAGRGALRVWEVAHPSPEDRQRALYEAITGSKLYEAFDTTIARPIGMEDYRLEDTEYFREPVSQHPAYLFRMSARDLARVPQESEDYLEELAEQGFAVESTACPMDDADLPPHRGRMLHYRRAGLAS